MLWNHWIQINKMIDNSDIPLLFWQMRGQDDGTTIYTNDLDMLYNLSVVYYQQNYVEDNKNRKLPRFPVLRASAAWYN
jgi:hypothetical protein